MEGTSEEKTKSMKKIFKKPNLSEKVKKIVFYPPTKSSAFWESQIIKEKQYLVLDVGRGGLTKKFKVEVLSNDTISIKSIFSVWDLLMWVLIAFLALIFVVSIVWQFHIGLTIFFAITCVALLISYILFYPYCWRTIRNSIRKLYGY